ncbi:MAG: aspartate carbamoyltransferase catalytic subunit [Proteobacteria bacterium]|nr:aspartate carbamoyltransferase catalytic subunit [Pseudomonadota bacterium]
MQKDNFKWNRKDLLGTYDLSKEEIIFLLDTAKSMEEVLNRDVKKVPTLRGKSCVTLFYEPSTRTRTSFELAGKTRSADTINISVSASSAVKGETILDSVKNIEAMSVDCVIIRHNNSGVPHFIARNTKLAVINAGDGSHEHPSQALLDLLTIRDYKGTIEGLNIAIVGDILHSRVARSNIFALKKLNNNVNLVGPKTFVPKDFEKFGANVFHNLEEGLSGVDVVMVLRLQKERMGKCFYPTEREYAKFFSVNRQSIKYAKEDAIIMHPGPVNRGLEISSDVLDGEKSVVLAQVTRGVAVRMAVLYTLLSGGRFEDSN